MYYALQWRWSCLVDGHGWDVKSIDAPKGASPGLGKRQRSLVFFLLLCFSLLNICAEGNWGCTAVCNGLLLFCKMRRVGCRAR